jgi:high-affinity iron transporter
MTERCRSCALIVLALMACAGLASPSHAEDQWVEVKAKQAWQLLDYVALDYHGAVSRGVVADASEYAEVQEFVATAERQLGELPRSQTSDALQRRTTRLRKAIADKADPDVVARFARVLARDLQEAYQFSVAPAAAPNLARGEMLFLAQCAACHGPRGQGDGPFTTTVTREAALLTQPSRARERTLFALYQIISSGVTGTAMASFAALPEDDRWAMTFFVGTLPYTDADKAAGERLWQSSIQAREAIAGLDALTQTSERALAEQLDNESAKGVTAYLRSTPQALAANRVGGVYNARAKLAESVAALRRGDRPAATRLALSAYLDGFELIEAALATRDHALYENIEERMAAYRAKVGSGSVAEAQTSEQALRQLLDEAERALLQSGDDATAAFIGALTKLLREGLGALLVVVAMVALEKAAKRKPALAYVHAGWLAALAAGGVTWAVVTHLLGKGGASRELAEGVSSMFAAVLLLGVSIWTYRKGLAGRLAVYPNEQLVPAPCRRDAWLVFSLVFIAAYCGMFETVLLCAALRTEGTGWPLLAGLAAGVALLGVLGAILLRAGARLSIGRLLALCSLLMVVLAVVLAGKGTAEMQEAGFLPTHAIAIPRIEILGIYPSWQSVLAQVVVLLAAVIVYVVTAPSRAGQSSG